MPPTSGERTAAVAKAAGVIPVTVVIPVRNEIASIDPLLDAISAQSPLAIIVVDAGSTDGTREALRARTAVQDRLQVIEVPKAYPGEGRNLGTAAAQTDWVVYIDGGIMPHADWLAALWRAVSGTNLTGAYGYYESAMPTLVARWFALGVLPPARSVPGGLMRNRIVPCSIVRRQAWETIGGFPATRAAEDRIFMSRLDELGVVETPAAVITWIGPSTWRQLWNRQTMIAEHSARAGRARDWHWPTLRYWLAGIAALVVTPWPVGITLVSIAWLLRVERRIRRHRLEPVLAERRPGDIPGVAAVLLVTDLAMFWGWLRRFVLPDAAPIPSAP